MRFGLIALLAVTAAACEGDFDFLGACNDRCGEQVSRGCRTGTDCEGTCSFALEIYEEEAAAAEAADCEEEHEAYTRCAWETSDACAVDELPECMNLYDAWIACEGG